MTNAYSFLYRSKLASEDFCTHVKSEKFKEVTDMTNISELDLQNLRHLIGGFDTTHCKM